MRYGIAIWNYSQEGKRLSELVRDFADFGFDTISFLPRQITALDSSEANELSSFVKDRGLITTIHGGCYLRRKDIETIITVLGNSLYSITLDAAMTSDSRGRFYDGPTMAAVLSEIKQCSEGTEMRFAVEDFPLDTLAVDYYQEALSGFLSCPRFGILIDLGHMNMRIRQPGSFKGYTPEEYMSRVPLQIIEVHIHDNTGERDSHGYLGFGNTDFEASARGLRDTGFAGISTIEVLPTPGITVEESIPRVLDGLET